jgi:hypothetical protein
LYGLTTSAGITCRRQAEPLTPAARGGLVGQKAGSPGWIDCWAQNDLLVFDDEHAAWGVIAGGQWNGVFVRFA